LHGSDEAGVHSRQAPAVRAARLVAPPSDGCGPDACIRSVGARSGARAEGRSLRFLPDPGPLGQCCPGVYRRR